MFPSRPSLALALLAACVDVEGDADDGVIVSAEDAHAQVAPALAGPEAPYDICTYLPESGPCALLCDRDALVAEYVPKNACVVFACELTNGESVTAHACHPAD
jgi:hypothetical protein